MWIRPQRTLQAPVQVTGVAMFSGADARVRILPAGPDHGIRFRRTDLRDAPTIPASIQYLSPLHRRTGLQRAEASVAMVEHVLAALAGLHIDNCIVEINAPEFPALDGSCKEYTEKILTEGIEELDVPIHPFPVPCMQIEDRTGASGRVVALPDPTGEFTVRYSLNYGSGSPIEPQTFSLSLSPERFARDIAPARTFVLESEVAQLRKFGYGLRMTAKNVLVFGARGVVDNRLRFPDECARHKVLDCIGDYSLLGHPLAGLVSAEQSGHALNHQFIKELIYSSTSNFDRFQGAAA